MNQKSKTEGGVVALRCAICGLPTHSDNKQPAEGGPRSRAEKFAGKLLILSTLASLIFIGLIINILQLILVCTIKLSGNRKWRRIHKKLNGNLVYLLFTQPTFLIYFWSKIKLNIVLENVGLIEDVRGPIMGIILANHTFELDWITCFVMADQLGNIGAYKCFAKDELKYLPIIGWAFWMSDLIYVKRNWKQDRVDINQKLDELLYYDQFLLGIFAEGTRYTPEKHRASVEFAKSRGIKPFKYHLYPRSRGFAYTIRHYLLGAVQHKQLDEKPVRVFNIEILMPGRPNFKHFIEGRQLSADIYCEEVCLSQEVRDEVLNSLDEDDCPKLSQFLLDVYRRKDALVEEYAMGGGRFNVNSPNGGHYPFEQPLRPFVYWSLCMSFTYGTLAYLATYVFAESITFWSMLSFFLSGTFLMLRRIERESKPRAMGAATFGKSSESDVDLLDDILTTKCANSINEDRCACKVAPRDKLVSQTVAELANNSESFTRRQHYTLSSSLDAEIFSNSPA